MREVASPQAKTEGENQDSDYPSVTCGDSSPDKGSQGLVRIRKINRILYLWGGAVTLPYTI